METKKFTNIRLKNQVPPFLPIAVKSKFGNFYHGNLYIHGKIVPGVFCTGKNKKECKERVILKYSRMQTEAEA